MGVELISTRFFLYIVAGSVCIDLVSGHGMLLDPVGRASRWRVDSSAPVNYDDNGLYCGGYWTHWGVNSGKCGFCGDSYSLPAPRPHELGGKYGAGVIVKTYNAGSTITVGARITVSHMGYFYFDICDLDSSRAESENCFQRLRLGNGVDRFPITSSSPQYYETTVQLPSGLICSHCVLRWTYVAGNNWGYCEDGTGALGCGPQETFKSCADITITGGKSIAEWLLDDIPEEAKV